MNSIFLQAKEAEKNEINCLKVQKLLRAAENMEVFFTVTKDLATEILI